MPNKKIDWWKVAFIIGVAIWVTCEGVTLIEFFNKL